MPIDPKALAQMFIQWLCGVLTHHQLVNTKPLNMIKDNEAYEAYGAHCLWCGRVFKPWVGRKADGC